MEDIVMATVKPKTGYQFNISGECLSHSRTDISVRDVETTTDEPVERDGTNMGLSPVETVMAALLGCTNVIGHKCAHKHGVEITAMSVDAVVTFDRRGAALMEEIDVPFLEIVLNISLTTTADDEAVEKMKIDLGRFCPVAKALRAGGTKITENWTVTKG
jgi:uncharacterized OsmC-like protein